MSNIGESSVPLLEGTRRLHSIKEESKVHIRNILLAGFLGICPQFIYLLCKYDMRSIDLSDILIFFFWTRDNITLSGRVVLWKFHRDKSYFEKCLLIYLFLSALGFHCCASAFSRCGERGLL